MTDQNSLVYFPNDQLMVQCSNDDAGMVILRQHEVVLANPLKTLIPVIDSKHLWYAGLDSKNSFSHLIASAFQGNNTDSISTMSQQIPAKGVSIDVQGDNLTFGLYVACSDSGLVSKAFSEFEHQLNELRKIIRDKIKTTSPEIAPQYEEALQKTIDSLCVRASEFVLELTADVNLRPFHGKINNFIDSNIGDGDPLGVIMGELMKNRPSQPTNKRPSIPRR